MSSVVTFSVVVNTTDRAKSLQTLLLALEQQSYPHFEVIVVVGPTRDDTMALLARYERRVQVIRCPKRNLSQSRNIGLMAAVGDVVTALGVVRNDVDLGSGYSYAVLIEWATVSK